MSWDSDAFLLAYDVGTSSLKGVVYSRDGKVLASATSRYENRYPQKDWAEADPENWRVIDGKLYLYFTEYGKEQWSGGVASLIKKAARTHENHTDKIDGKR